MTSGTWFKLWCKGPRRMSRPAFLRPADIWKVLQNSLLVWGTRRTTIWMLGEASLPHGCATICLTTEILGVRFLGDHLSRRGNSTINRPTMSRCGVVAPFRWCNAEDAVTYDFGFWSVSRVAFEDVVLTPKFGEHCSLEGTAVSGIHKALIGLLYCNTDTCYTYKTLIYGLRLVT